MIPVPRTPSPAKPMPESCWLCCNAKADPANQIGTCRPCLLWMRDPERAPEPVRSVNAKPQTAQLDTSQQSMLNEYFPGLYAPAA